GFGVVFSDATLRGIDEVDPLLLQALTDHGVHWDEIEVRVHGERWRCGGNGMAAIARMTLLRLLHEQAAAAGVELRFEHDVPRSGVGVVFSDATLRGIDEVDPLLLQALTDHGVHWDEIEVRVHGERWRCGGNGMAAIARMTLLRLLHEQAAAAGVELRFEHDVP